ncbi:hypothetical protein [Bacillus sp. NPDC094106]
MYQVYTYINGIKYYTNCDTEKECDDFTKSKKWDIYWAEKL